MKKIVYVQHSTGHVGAPTSLLYLIEGLDRAKYAPCVLFCDNGPIVDLYRSRNIQVKVETGLPTFGHTVPGRAKFRSIRPWRPVTGWLSILMDVNKYKRILEDLNPDIVHVNSAVLPAAAIAARKLKIPVVWHIREQLYDGLWGVRKRIFRKIIESTADQIIVLSEASKRQFNNTEKINVIYNFVDFESFNRCKDGKAIRQRLNISDSDMVIGFMGGTLPHKGCLILLEAMQYVHAVIPESHLVILGNTKAPSLSPSRIKRKIKSFINKLFNLNACCDLHSRLQALAFQKKIHLVGEQLNVPDWIAACDMIAVPSTEDHFARPVIEAGAMAKPVVASDWPSIREIVDAEQTGLLAEPNNPRAFADAIIMLFRDRRKAERMGEAGYLQALEKFNTKEQLKKINRIYDNLFNLR